MKSGRFGWLRKQPDPRNDHIFSTVGGPSAFRRNVMVNLTDAVIAPPNFAMILAAEGESGRSCQSSHMKRKGAQP